jgi:nucleotide-binding universal stress UspA family protein
VAMFSTILLATDGSPGAHAAVLSATALAHHNGGRIIVVHAANAEDMTPQGVRDQVGELRRAGIPARLAVVGKGGGAAPAIAQMAAAWKADVVVTGIRGAGAALRGAVVGEFTQRLISLSPCPVLAVPD